MNTLRLARAPRVLALLLTVLGLWMAPAPVAAQLEFFMVSPCRVVETRVPAPLGGLDSDTETGTPLLDDASRDLQVEGVCGIPANAQGVLVMLAAVNSTASGNIVVYEEGTSAPNTSSINFSAGENRAGNTYVNLSGSGKIAALAKLSGTGGKVHFVLDVTGYLAPGLPEAVDDNYATERNTVLNVPAGSGVTSNDALNEATIVSYGASTGAEQTTIGAATPTSAGGSVSLNLDGSFSYTPPTDAVLIDDTFKYVIQNAVGSSTGTVTIGVGKQSQTITFTSTAPSDAAVGGPTYTVAATASSTLPVTFTIDATATSVCTITGSTVSFIGAGTCVINANQAGDANYNPAPQVQQSFAVAKGDQTITFTSTAPADAKVGGPTYTVTATATSGLAVAFTIDPSASAVCSITGSTVSFLAVGTCVVNANQAGDANWNAAPQVQQSFAVAKGDQTISFTSTAPADATVNGPTYNVTATATSGLPVTLTIDASATSVCSITGSTVSFLTAGTCVINANQAGDANWNAAPQVQQSFAVSLASQTIEFTSTAPVNAQVGGPTYTVTATATSGLPVTFTIDASASAVCTITGSTVSFIGVGTCVINANQAGDASFSAAPQVQQSFAVAKGDQTITFTSTAPVNAKVGGPTYTVTATATSGLPVTFTIDPSASAVCSISGSTVSFLTTGTCVINANQAGDANWNAAPQAQQSFAVAPGDQTITFTSTAPVNAKVNGPTYTVTATATSGLPVTFTIDPSAASVCSLSGSTVSFIGAGTCVINANQAGNANWNPAPQAQQSFAVAKGDQTITFTSTAPVGATVSGPTYTVTATATSGLAVVFSIDASAASVCTLSGSTVSFIGGGTCVINANQPGDANWNAAPQVQQSFAVVKQNQTISFTSAAPVGATVSGPTYNVTATATSGLAVAFSIDPSAASVCTIAGSTVSFIGAGTCVINANQAGNFAYNAAPQVQQSFLVVKQNQTITFTSTPPTLARIGGPTYTVTATATSGLAVTFTIDASSSSVCTIAGSTVSFIGGGTCLINANQAGNFAYNPAPQVQQSVQVNRPPQFTTNPVTYTTPGNTQLHVAGATLPGVASWSDASGLVAKSGATDPDSVPSPLSVVAATGTSANGGSYAITVNGTFTYVPAAGFSGSDSFSFQVTDGLDTTTGTVNVTVGTRVWYIHDVVSGNNPAGGDGRSTNPFDSVAGFNAATTNNGDIIYVFEGNTATTPHSGTITLRDGQKLWGQGIALDVPGFGTSLVAAGNRSRLRTTTASTDVVSVPATGGSRSNVEIRGLDLEATGATSNAIDVTASGANTVGITISNNNVRGATAEGVDLNAGSTSTFSATVQSNTVTAAGNGIDTRVNATGVTTVTASSNMITSTAGNAFDARTLAGASALRVSFDNGNVGAAGNGIIIDGSAAGTTTITGFANNVVDGNSAGTGIVITSATFDGTAGGTFQTISAGTTTVGASGNGVGGPGMVLTNVQGDLSFTDLDVFADGGAGLRASSPTTYTGSAGLRFVTGSASMVEATSGPAVDFTQATVTLPFTSIRSTNSPTTGVALNSVAGSFSAGSGSITGSTGTAFQVGSSSATVSYGGTITSTAGRGVDLTSNTGGTISFTGALTLSSGTNTAFNATGGGTVTSTDSGSTLTSTTATALNVANTTIGASGLTFRTISAGTGASGPTSGIVLNTTGSGGLTVSGTGSAGSGGTIQRATGPGISLTGAANVNLSFMNVQNGGDDGIRGSGVNGLNLTSLNVSANGNAVGEHGIELAGLTGNGSMSNSTVTGSAEHNVSIANTTGTLSAFNVTNSSFTNTNMTTGSDGFLLENNGTGAMTVSITGSTFTDNKGDHFQLATSASATGSVGITFSNNTLSTTAGNDPNVVGGGITISPSGSADVTFTINSNNIQQAYDEAINLNLGTASTAAASMIGTVSNNTIGTAGDVDSGSESGTGISVISNGAGLTTVSITGNQVRQFANPYGILVNIKEGSSSMNATVTGNTVSNPGSFAINGIRVDAGATAGDSGTLCALVTGNSVAGSGPAADTDIRLRQRFNTTIRLPGYGGGNSDTTAVNSFVAGNNAGSDVSSAHNVGGGGNGFVGGAACPTP